jgi:U3 small nucleolar RNA-associated protein 10
MLNFVAPCIVEMLQSTNNDSLWKLMNYKLLMHTRDDSNICRLTTLKILLHIITMIEERYLILIEDSIPFLTECLEDIDEDMPRIVNKIFIKLESFTGESIHKYLN